MTTLAASVTFMLNGAEVRASAEHPHVLAALREELGITSPKDGCAPSGQCGCCTVLLDGKATIACQLSMEKVTEAARVVIGRLSKPLYKVSSFGPLNPRFGLDDRHPEEQCSAPKPAVFRVSGAAPPHDAR